MDISSFILFFNNPYLHLGIGSASFVLRAFLWGKLLQLRPRNIASSRTYFLLSSFIVTLLVCMLVSLMRLLYSVYIFCDPIVMNTALRVSWILYILRYQLFMLLVENVLHKGAQQSLAQRSLLLIGWFICLVLSYITIFAIKTSYLKTLYVIANWYTFGLMLICLMRVYSNFELDLIPKIIRNQLTTFGINLVFPYFVLRLIQILPFTLIYTLVRSEMYLSFTAVLTTYIVYYTIKKLTLLRFLHINDHVQSEKPFTFMDDFRLVLERLNAVASPRELIHISQQFFKDSFDIPLEKTILYFRGIESTGSMSMHSMSPREITLEKYKRKFEDNTHLVSYMQKHCILIAEEVAFDDFYTPSERSRVYLDFMNVMKADIFIPIYIDDVIRAYMIIGKNARKKLYSKTERDQMVVFSRYLGNIIDVLSKKNLMDLVAERKSLQDELLAKSSECQLYKESMFNFSHETDETKAGILFYKDGRFSMVNEISSKMIGINPNKDRQTMLSKALHQVASQVDQMKVPRTSFAITEEGKKIIVSGFYDDDANKVILSMVYARPFDIAKKHIALLKDPSYYDYIMYLQTTRSGRLIDQLIPSSAKLVLDFKIKLLKAALSRKVVLLDLAGEDLEQVVELIHHISLRSVLHTLVIKSDEEEHEIGIQLFGINPLYGNLKDQPLVERLDKQGTIFIKNVHRLSMQTQEHLANYIKYGFYKTLKSEHQVTADVRIIVSSYKDLGQLVKNGKFSAQLYDQLRTTIISLEPLNTLSKKEFDQLADDISVTFKGSKKITDEVLALTSLDKEKLADKKPLSISDFIQAVQVLLKEKTQKKVSALYEESTFDNRYDGANNLLVQAARLGKHSLKDNQVMSFLWAHFDKKQSEIAEFLGVNRSSVNRRCKEYGLE